MSAATKNPHPYTASIESVGHIARLVEQARPDWDTYLVRIVLMNLAGVVDGTDLAIVALRAALNTSLPTPKAIVWRGDHWRDLASDPPAGPLKPPRCIVCGRIEPVCWSARHGDDDHAFEAKP